MQLPSTTERIPAHTRDVHNRKIRAELENRIYYYARNRDEIDERLEELDREWDMERTLETNAAGLALGGTLLSLLDRRFLVIPGLVTAFLLQHALQGWCPPVNLFRRFGRRTQTEIETERYALRALRGDFAEIGTGGDDVTDARRVLELVEDKLPG